MLHDGYWQEDLLSFANKILFWKRKINKLIDMGCEYTHEDMSKALHRVTQLIFFSACTIRKMIEEENESIETIKKCNKMLPCDGNNDPKCFFDLYYQTIEVYQLPLKKEKINFFCDYCADDYDFLSSQKVQYSVKKVSNWIIHSYIWNLQSYDQNDNHINGLVVSSDYDRTMFACYVDLESWCGMLRSCANQAYL